MLLWVGLAATLALGIAYGAGTRALPLTSPAATSTLQGHPVPAAGSNYTGAADMPATALLCALLALSPDGVAPWRRGDT